MLLLYIFSNSYEKWVTYICGNDLHLCVFLWFQTYDDDPPSTPCHKLTMILLHDPNDPTSSFSESSSSLADNCFGVLCSSSSCFDVPSFHSNSASQFTSYLKIGNSYSSSFGSLSFSGHFFFYVSSNEYRSSLFVPNRYFSWHNKWVMQLWFVGLSGHGLYPGACRKSFIKSKSNICIIVTYTLYSCMLVLNTQYPTLTLQSTSIASIYL